MQTIKIGAREFQVTKTGDGYLLTGKRGASYRTMRNVHRPEFMFLVHATKGFGIPAGFEQVGLTDRAGVLEVLS